MLDELSSVSESELLVYELISDMINEDLREAKKDAILKKEGFTIHNSRE